jgi:hypothetical protein
MYSRLLLLLLLLVLPGCLDGLGIGSACESEMQDVRRRHGAPDQQARGVRSEIWLYGRSPGGFYYEFSWGSAGEPCQVVGPISQSLLPDRDLLLDAGAPAEPRPGEDRPSIRGGETR